MNALPLPLTVEEITPDWLTSALSAGYLGTVVTDLVVRRVIWGTATKVMLEVSYASESPVPRRLCVKGGFRPELRPLMSLGYQVEALFYRDLSRNITGALTSYFAAADPSVDQGVVVMADLCADGHTFNDVSRPLTVDQAAAGLEALAVLHSGAGVDTPPWIPPTPHYRPLAMSTMIAPPSSAALAMHSPNVVALVENTSLLRGAFDAIWADEDSGPQCLVHGDANYTNTVLDPDGHPRLLDWQFICRSAWTHDVALFLISVLSIEDRRRHERELLEGHLKTLAALGAQQADWDSCWASYRRHSVYGLTYALVPPEMQPPEVCVPLADRFAAAASDLEAFALLGA
jgi:hypothetical protein